MSEFVVRAFKRYVRKWPAASVTVEATNVATAIDVARAKDSFVAATPLDRIEVRQGGAVVKPKRDESRSARWRRSGAEDHL